MFRFTASTGLLCAVSLLWCMGCSGRSDLPDLGTVSGTVTVDGNPTASIMVHFSPVDGGRTSTGVTDSSGQYKLDYTADAKGAVVGKHNVTLSAQAEAASDDQLDLSGSNSAIPDKYKGKTFEFEVKSGSNTFDIKLE